MPILFIGSTGDRAGHSLITWAIARKFMDQGLAVGFLKPFGTDPVFMQGRWVDHDAFLLKEALHLKEPLERICPVLISDESWKTRGREKLMAEFKSLAQDFAAHKDLLIIMGSKHIFFDEPACPIHDISFISELQADCLLVHRHRMLSRSLYSILSVCSLVKENIRGIVLNRIPAEEMEQVSSELIPTLRQNAIPITAAIQEDALLSLRSLREVSDILGADILWGEEHLHKPAGGMTVGSADLAGRLVPFKRAYNKIIFLESSFQTQAEQSPGAPRAVAGILLTGGRRPPGQLLEAAMKARVPLLLVQDDTFAALEKLEQSVSHLSPRDEVKIRHVTELMERDGGFEQVAKSLGLPRSGKG